MLLSLQLNILTNDFIVFVPWGFLKLREYWKNRKKEKLSCECDYLPMGGGSGLSQRSPFQREVGSSLAWAQTTYVLGLSNLQSQDHLTAYSSREICYIWPHERASCFWLSLRAVRRFTFSVLVTLLPSLLPPSLPTSLCPFFPKETISDTYYTYLLASLLCSG